MRSVVERVIREERVVANSSCSSSQSDGTRENGNCNILGDPLSCSVKNVNFPSVTCIRDYQFLLNAPKSS